MTRLILLFLLLVVFGLKTEAQDTLIFEGKYPLPVRIVRETDTRVFYKKISEKDTMLYFIEKRFVSDVVFKNPEDRKLKFKPDPIDRRALDVWVTCYDSSSVIKGTLHNLNDTTLFIRKKKILQKSKQGSGGAGAKCRKVPGRHFLETVSLAACPVEGVGYIRLNQVPFQMK